MHGWGVKLLMDVFIVGVRFYFVKKKEDIRNFKWLIIYKESRREFCLSGKRITNNISNFKTEESIGKLKARDLKVVFQRLWEKTDFHVRLR